MLRSILMTSVVLFVFCAAGCDTGGNKVVETPVDPTMTPQQMQDAADADMPTD